jgi:hypothetical protein
MIAVDGDAIIVDEPGDIAHERRVERLRIGDRQAQPMRDQRIAVCNAVELVALATTDLHPVFGDDLQKIQALFGGRFEKGVDELGPKPGPRDPAVSVRIRPPPAGYGWFR